APAAQDLVRLIEPGTGKSKKELSPVKGAKRHLRPIINQNPFIPASACRVAAEATKNAKYLKPKAPQKAAAKHPPLWIPSSSTMVAADRLKLPNIKRTE
ncbi:MAG TPA: hypothetical protein VLG44_02700, partial [Chlamydiales bacterium]|nr:hypothetical protein [Chlamydiales bacterium]